MSIPHCCLMAGRAVKRPDIPQLKPDIPQLRPDIPQLRPDIPQLRPDIPQLRPDISQLREAAIAMPQLRCPLCESGADLPNRFDSICRRGQSVRVGPVSRAARPARTGPAPPPPSQCIRVGAPNASEPAQPIHPSRGREVGGEGGGRPAAVVAAAAAVVAAPARCAI